MRAWKIRSSACSERFCCLSWERRYKRWLHIAMMLFMCCSGKRIALKVTPRILAAKTLSMPGNRGGRVLLGRRGRWYSSFHCQVQLQILPPVFSCSQKGSRYTLEGYVICQPLSLHVCTVCTVLEFVYTKLFVKYFATRNWQKILLTVLMIFSKLRWSLLNYCDLLLGLHTNDDWCLCPMSFEFWANFVWNLNL